ncbi:MAG: hypothetical protein ACRDIB_17055, partial [Ardenticatenaceae bacterium]
GTGTDFCVALSTVPSSLRAAIKPVTTDVHLPTAEGTLFKVLVEGEPRSALLGLATPLLAHLVEGQYNSDLDCLKDSLENQVELTVPQTAG